MELPPRWQGPLRAFGVLSSRGAALLLQVGLLAVVGRALGVEGLGLFALFVGWLSIVGTLGAFGAPMHSPRDPSPAAAGRPLAADGASRFGEYDFRYERCFDVKPGITGLWRVLDRMEPPFTDPTAKDFEYIDHWSVWRELRILVMTPVAMIRGGR